MSRYRINQKLRIRVNRMNRVLAQSLKASPSTRSLPDLSKYDNQIPVPTPTPLPFVNSWNDSTVWDDGLYWNEV